MNRSDRGVLLPRRVAWTGSLLQAMGVWDGVRRWLLTLGGLVGLRFGARGAEGT